MPLILGIKLGQVIRIGDDIIIKIDPSPYGGRNRVEVYIDAPKDVRIERVGAEKRVRGS